MQISDRGLAFVARHEGFVSRAYKDPVGVLTIGYGFTMGSRIFADYWRARYGRGLMMGDTIDRATADMLLRKMIDEEYGREVTRVLGPLPQHQHDASCSVAFNLGPRALTWRWAVALKAGNVSGAANILGANYNTAGGRKLAGLVRRRREEARLLRDGDYGDGRAASGEAARSAAARGDAAAEAGEMLAQLGYPVTDLPAAIRKFQQDNPPLVVDGIWGPASRSTAQRRLTAQSAGTAAKVMAPAAGATGVAAEQVADVDWTTIAYALGTTGALAVLGYLAWVNRGRIWAAVPAGVRGAVENLFRGG
ncbi:lysozyme [Stappia sp. WLB 29]|uniref:lysozyme n=1 Tax=Stappia sp. WLB 29 TaxID=2925220 RepID=UPI0020BF3241|nr:lysozyme [Stappia sp. WLB 29]